MAEPRPQMRRKSSAGTLLSFRSPSSSSNPLSSSTAHSSTGALGMYQNQVAMGGFMSPQPSVTSTSNSYHSGSMPSSEVNLMSPSMGQPTGKDWDSQSASESNTGHSVGSGPSSMGPPSSVGAAMASSAALGLPPNQMELMRETVNKRIMTLTYLRSTHEGKMYWFNTILLTREALAETFNNVQAAKKRAYRFSVLAMSLANLFDIQAPSEYLKALIALMTEFEAFQDDTIKPRVKRVNNLFRASKVPKRPGAADYTVAYDASDNYLVTPNVPFDLDYQQTVISLADILSETYQKLLRNLGPLPNPLASSSGTSLSIDGRPGAQTPHSQSNAANMFLGAGTSQQFGPLGVLTPYPGLTSLWPGGTPSVDEMGEGSLWNLASSGPAISVNMLHSGSSSVAKELEGVKLVDGKLKKIIAVLLKELDQFARTAIKAELESLDPLLKNLVPDQMQGDGGDEY